MQRRKTHFEQVAIDVAEKALEQATALAIARRSLAPLSVQKREAMAESTKQPGKGMRKERI
jgi:hypothetical protein